MLSLQWCLVPDNCSANFYWGNTVPGSLYHTTPFPLFSSSLKPIRVTSRNQAIWGGGGGEDGIAGQSFLLPGWPVKENCRLNRTSCLYMCAGQGIYQLDWAISCPETSSWAVCLTSSQALLAFLQWRHWYLNRQIGWMVDWGKKYCKSDINNNQ